MPVSDCLPIDRMLLGSETTAVRAFADGVAIHYSGAVIVAMDAPVRAL